MDHHDTLAMGTVVGGKYKVERLIGAGGMGAVYLVSQVGLGRKAALKVLHPALCSDAALTERFHREASLAASIGHDNICEVTDFGVDEGGMPFLVMPHLKGQSLREILTGGSLPLERLSDILRQVLSALDAAHIKGVVHRDLKPDNIFITKLGDRDDFVKLLDFGISKVLESDPVKELTRTGTVLGTADYMAPEQARGDRTVDHRLDIYAAGVILYEASTGRRPYTGASFSEILLKIVTEEFPPPSAVNPSVPRELEALILKAMARNPADRFAGAEEMAEALDKAARSIRARMSVTDETAPTAFAVRKVSAPSPRSNRKRGYLLAGAATLLLLIIGAAVSIGLRVEDTRAVLPKPVVLPTATSLPFPSPSAPAAPHQAPPALPTGPTVTANALSLPGSVEPSNEAQEPAAAADSTSAAAAPQVAVPPKKGPPSNLPKKSPLATDGAPAEPPVSSGGSPSSQPSLSLPKQSYSNMNQLKIALREGKITKLQYREHQTEIRQKRAAEYERLKADYRKGAITKIEYERSVDEVRRKYEGD